MFPNVERVGLWYQPLNWNMGCIYMCRSVVGSVGLEAIFWLKHCLYSVLMLYVFLRCNKEDLG